MAHEVTVGHAGSIPLSVVRRRAPRSALSRVVPAACGAVWNVVREQKGEGAGRHVALYLECDASGQLSMEIGVEIPVPVAHGEVVASQTPAGTVATAAHIGSYARLGDAHAAIARHCNAHGLEFAGPSWEIYGHWTDDDSKLRTDVFYLLKSA